MTGSWADCGLYPCPVLAVATPACSHLRSSHDFPSLIFKPSGETSPRAAAQSP